MWVKCEFVRPKILYFCDTLENPLTFCLPDKMLVNRLFPLGFVKYSLSIHNFWLGLSESSYWWEKYTVFCYCFSESGRERERPTYRRDNALNIFPQFLVDKKRVRWECNLVFSNTVDTTISSAEFHRFFYSRIAIHILQHVARETVSFPPLTQKKLKENMYLLPLVSWLLTFFFLLYCLFSDKNKHSRVPFTMQTMSPLFVTCPPNQFGTSGVAYSQDSSTVETLKPSYILTWR